jgi:beta-glucosidase
VTRVASLVAELTLDEKCQLLHGASDPEGAATGYIPPIERLDIPPLRLVDGPLGVRAEGESATAFPASIALAASWDPGLAREQGTAMAREARAHGQDVLLAPGLNIVRVPHGGRNFEYYSEDPHLSSRLGVGYIEGIQSAGVIATAKHYVANNQETNRYEVSAKVTERALREIYLPAFRAAVEEADVGSVMTAYNRVNGTHMSDHRSLLRDVLKEEYGFDGFVVSDWWGTESTVGAASAGLDVEMPGIPFTDLFEEAPDDVDPAAIDLPETLPAMDDGGLFGEPLREAVENGDVDEATIDEKVHRLLRTMDRFGMLDGNREDDTTARGDDREDGALDTPEHRQLARRIAVEGTVLLQNDGVLPLDDDTTVALVGPNADAAKLGGGGSSEVEPFTRTSPLDGLRERAADLSFERGVPPIPESSLFDAFAPDETTDEPDDASLDDAVTAAETADCAVVVVQDDATEATDRDDLRLPGGQDELVERVASAAERTVVVLRTSGPVEMPWAEDVDSVVESWYAGQADGDALAAVLYGDADPGGRLPVTFSRRAADYPTNTTERFPGVDDAVVYDEVVFVGYRYFDREETEPRYPFGHGLSYTTFEYGEPTVERDEERVTLTVPVRNTGERSGTEVVQVYVREDEPSVPRPDRELRGFTKLRLDPGERRHASVTLDRDAFAYYDEDDGWTVPPGTFTLLVGRSSRDVRGDVTIEL